MTVRSLTMTFAATLAAFALAACGGGHDAGSGGHSMPMSGGGTQTEASSGAELDRAFVAAMIPHHESAIEMAKVAQTRAQSDFVRGLAQDITASQAAEIDQMRAIDAKLAKTTPKVGDLGLADHMMGMDGDLGALRKADPFDAAFIGMMIPHHEGAVMMAEQELAKGQDPGLKSIASNIIKAQRSEIVAMKNHRPSKRAAASPTATPASATATPARSSKGSGAATTGPPDRSGQGGRNGSEAPLPAE